MGQHRVAVLATCNLDQWAMDFEGNLRRITRSIAEARRQGARYRVRPWLDLQFLAAIKFNQRLFPKFIASQTLNADQPASCSFIPTTPKRGEQAAHVVHCPVHPFTSCVTLSLFDLYPGVVQAVMLGLSL